MKKLMLSGILMEDSTLVVGKLVLLEMPKRKALDSKSILTNTFTKDSLKVLKEKGMASCVSFCKVTPKIPSFMMVFGNKE